MSTIYTNQNLTIVSQAGGGSQVQVPGQNITLSPDQTRRLGIAVGFSLVTSSNIGPWGSVASPAIIISYNSASVIVASPSNYVEGRVTVAVTLPDATLYSTLLTFDQARTMANAIESYTVV